MQNVINLNPVRPYETFFCYYFRLQLKETSYYLNGYSKYIPLFSLFYNKNFIIYGDAYYGYGSTVYNSYKHLHFIFAYRDYFRVIVIKHKIIVSRGFIGILKEDDIIPVVVVMVRLGCNIGQPFRPSKFKVLINKKIYNTPNVYRGLKIWINKLIKWCRENKVKVYFKDDVSKSVFANLKLPKFKTIREKKLWCDGLVQQFKQHLQHEKESKTESSTEVTQKGA